jgi:hypothetical protein
MRAVIAVPAVLAVLAVLAADVVLARAEPPGLVIPVPTEQPAFVTAPAGEAPVEQRSSYRWQMLALDTVAIGSLAMAVKDDSENWGMFGLGAYALGAPIIHAGNGHGGRALGSLGLRIGVPLIAGFVGMQIGARDPCGAPMPGITALCDGTSPDARFAKGLVVGGLLAMALDTWLIARPETKVRRGWSPTASATRNGGAVGVSGAF